MHGGRLKVALTAPPVDGKANEALRRFVAEATGVASSRVEILRGDTGREKTIHIEGIDAPTLRSAFARLGISIPPSPTETK